jgi:hypothetical protein
LQDEKVGANKVTVLNHVEREKVNVKKCYVFIIIFNKTDNEENRGKWQDTLL